MKNGKENIYPITIEDNGNSSVTYLGLTKREYFAGLALQGMMANQHLTSTENDTIARWSVEIADALLAELEKTKQLEDESKTD